METLASFVVFAALITRFLGKDRAAMTLFAVGLVLATILFRIYATNALKLDF